MVENIDFCCIGCYVIVIYCVVGIEVVFGIFDISECWLSGQNFNYDY